MYYIVQNIREEYPTSMLVVTSASVDVAVLDRLLLPSHGGDERGGFGIWRIGSGEAFADMTSVTPGMAGMNGGR